MTVAELIEALKGLPQDAEVVGLFDGFAPAYLSEHSVVLSTFQQQVEEGRVGFDDDEDGSRPVVVIG